MAKKKQETALVLRTCFADMTSYGGFQWPNEVGAIVEATDWKKNAKCGNGLHGWLHGEGDHCASDSISREGAKWLVVEVVRADVIALGGKVKFPRGTIRHIGDRASATEYLLENEPHSANVAVIGACKQVGDKKAVQVGALGTASAGDWGTASAGDEGTASAGYKGTASAGDWGTASAGEKGEIRIKYWDKGAERYRTVIGYIGENALEPSTPYKLDDKHEFVKA